MVERNLLAKEDFDLSEREIAMRIEEMKYQLAKAIKKGVSVEIFKVNGNTIKFSEVKKTVIQ